MKTMYPKWFKKNNEGYRYVSRRCQHKEKSS